MNKTTPQAHIKERLQIGNSCILLLPVNANYVVCEGPSLPPELGFSDRFPRTYSVVGMEKSTAHAHREGTEKEIMYVVAGQATVYLWDRQGRVTIIFLEPAKPGEQFRAIFVPAGIWHTVRYKPGTVLNVVASTIYDRSYYCEDPTVYFDTIKALRRYNETFPG